MVTALYIIIIIIITRKLFQDRNKWRRRIKGATGKPRFTWKNGR